MFEDRLEKGAGVSPVDKLGCRDVPGTGNRQGKGPKAGAPQAFTTTRGAQCLTECEEGTAGLWLGLCLSETHTWKP